MELTYHEARNRVLEETLETRPDVFLVGGNSFSGPFEPPNRLRARFGDRVRIAPISEMAYAGIGIGAALGGMHPVIDFSTASFMFNAWEMVVNEAPNHRYMSGGRVQVPVLFHILAGSRGAGGAQHSHSPQAMLMNTPGLKIFCPATPQDVMGLFRTAMDDPNPCVFVDHIRLFMTKGEVADPSLHIPFGKARIAREGEDVSVVASSFMLHVALAAAEQLAAESVSVEVIDPRTLVPFDEETILASVRKTGRLVVVDETHLTAGVASEIAARIGEKAFAVLKAPILRVSSHDVPVPFSGELEGELVPTVDNVTAAIRRVGQYRR